MSAPLSIVIKTFQRPASLKNLLASIRKLGLKYPVLVADDGKESVEEMLEKEFSDLPLTYLRLPFDTGLSEGRNVLVRHVKTAYFVLCDDDYVFDERTDFESAFQAMKKNNIDILGGNYYNYVNIPDLKVFVRQLTHPFRLKRFFLNQFQTSRYIGIFNIEGKSCELLISNKKPARDLQSCDLVNNFFIADTQKVLAMGGWDKELKMGEHEDFFLRVKQHGLKVAYLSGFGTRHYPAIPIKNSMYAAYRERAAGFKKIFAKKHGFENYTEKEPDTGKILFNLKTNNI